MLPEEQVENIKKQLLDQIENFPADKREQAKAQIEAMNSEELEQFLIQNNLIQDSESGTSNQVSQGKCIFCSIAQGETPSYKIDENKDSIAILELNPISKGHTLIVPKQHIQESDKIPQTAFTLAKKISKKLKTKFKPKEVLISATQIMNHQIINVLPIYEDETLESKREQASKEELEKLKKLLEKKTTVKKPKPKKLKKEEQVWLPIRIP